MALRPSPRTSSSWSLSRNRTCWKTSTGDRDMISISPLSGAMVTDGPRWAMTFTASEYVRAIATSSSFEPFDGVVDQRHDLRDIHLKRPDLEGSDAKGAKTTPHSAGDVSRGSKIGGVTKDLLMVWISHGSIMSAEFPRGILIVLPHSSYTLSSLSTVLDTYPTSRLCWSFQRLALTRPVLRCRLR